MSRSPYSAALVILFGLGILLWAGLAYSHTRAFVRDAAEVDGVVTEIVKHSGGKGSTYTPIVEFTTESGEDWTARPRTSIGMSLSNFHVGEHVGVLYGSSDPGRARIDRFMPLWGEAFLEAVWGMVIASAGLWRLIKG